MSAKKIVLLTSKDNFVWTSMQEIIPMIEDVWTRYCLKNNLQLSIINVDESSPSNYMRVLIESDFLVATCFNLKISHFLRVTRDDLKIDSKIIFYLHGLATIALWPLHRFGLLQLMKSSDIFIGTCEGDLNSLKLTLDNFSSAKVPFILPDFNPSPKKTDDTKPFVYIGRISPQKNLDQLIIAYSKLDDIFRKKHPLYLYGSEDNLGYPNIGLSENNYLQKLKALTNEYNLSTDVAFKGFVDRIQIQNELGNHFVFISCSTHSDENFGMAAFRSLLAGANCVLTSWGGHKEFKTRFPDKIHYINPELNTEEIASAMIKASAVTSKPESPAFYSMESVFKNFDELLDRQTENHLLRPTELALTIYNQQKEFEANGQIQRCFKSFEDPAFKAFYEAYL